MRNWRAVGLLRLLAGGMCLLLLSGCPRGPGPVPVALKPVAAKDLPDFQDDLDRASLVKAVERSLQYYHRLPAARIIRAGGLSLSVAELRRSLRLLEDLSADGSFSRDEVARFFDVYSATASPGTQQHLIVTGYYEPVLAARLQPDAEFRYPIYRLPDDLVKVSLGEFGFSGKAAKRIVGRLENHRLRPYFNREDIDGRGKLAGRGLELAWLRDPVDVFFLHIQGSGVLELADHSRRRVGYAGTNGRPYRSIGKYMIEQGMVSRKEMSLQAIRRYLRDHPEKISQVLYTDQSYVFFRWVDDGPRGSLGVSLVAGRSVAADAGIYPRGIAGFLISTRPRVDDQGAVQGWVPLQRFVFNHDTGGAIKGPFRLDLFCGTGEKAAWTAGRLKQPGRFYVLIAKKAASGAGAAR